MVRDHPRIRGEHHRPPQCDSPPRGSSPHTRGARSLSPRASQHRGIIPAYAGSTPSGTPPRAISRDHPRIRGEHATTGPSEGRSGGSSPHTRGARDRRGSAWTSARIIPAYAGSTLANFPVLSALWDHPRIRGEHAVFSGAVAVVKGSSPHTRGARQSGRSLGGPAWIIPAYAGSTLGGQPRAFGEGIIPAYAGSTNSNVLTEMFTCGSSPHTRGAL